jgi:hypothetical protein
MNKAEFIEKLSKELDTTKAARQVRALMLLLNV